MVLSGVFVIVEKFGNIVVGERQFKARSNAESTFTRFKWIKSCHIIALITFRLAISDTYGATVIRS